MDKVFLTILNMSLTGAFVIAAVCLARLTLKKAPKIISYCLWAVVGFRLVFPFSIEGVLSLMPIKPQPIPIQLSTMEHADVISSIDSGSVVVDGTIERMLTYARTSVSGNPYSAMTKAISYLWLIGAVAMLLYGVVSYIRLLRRIDNVTVPCVYGFIKPKIHIPGGLSESEYAYILLHEQTHIRRHDHIVKFGAYFILCLHWFNPLAWVAFILMGVDMEMSCDERVLKELGGETKHDYSRSLLSLATEKRVIGGSPLAFSEGGIKQRIKNVLNFKKPSRVIVTLAVVLVAVLSIGFAVNRAIGEPLIEFEVVYNNVTEYSRTEQFKHDDILYSVYIVDGEIQTLGSWRGLKEIGYAYDDFGKFRIFEREGYSIDEFIVVQDYGFMNGAAIYVAENRDATLTLDELRTLAAKGDALQYSDFPHGGFVGLSAIAGGYNPVLYGVEGGYRMIVNFNDTMNPESGISETYLQGIWDDNGTGIDIRFSDVDEYLRAHPSHPAIFGDEALAIAEKFTGKKLTLIDDVDWWEREDEFPHSPKDPSKRKLDESLETIEPCELFMDAEGGFYAVGREFGTVYEYSDGVWKAH